MKYNVRLKVKYSSAEIIIPAYSTATLDLLMAMLKDAKTKDGDPVEMSILPIYEEEPDTKLPQVFIDEPEF